jgi:hypothetical protein
MSIDPSPLAGPVCTSPKLPDATNVRIPPTYQYLIDLMANTSQPLGNREEAQIVVEESLVSQASCSGLNPNIVDRLRTHIYDLDARVLDGLFESTDTLNSSIHSDLACIVSAVVHPQTLGTGAPLARERIRQWFVSLRQIGKPSVEGYALATSFSSDTSLFVMKSPRKPEGDQLVHEAAIGILALNKLRAWVPNFMYVYGYARCSPPVLENKEPVTWCSSDTPAVSYLISENIRNAVTIGDFITEPQVTIADILGVYLQVFNALNVASKAHGYTHYDLHGGNIMIRKFPTPIAVPYYATNSVAEGPVGYVVSQYVPYIIDYGYNRIAVDGVSLGKLGLERAGINPALSFPMYDVYKNICFVAENLLRAYSGVALDNAGTVKLSVLQALVSFFGTEPITDRVMRRLADLSDYYGVDSAYSAVTLDQYLAWIHSGGIELPLFTEADARAMGAIIPELNKPVDVCRFYDSIDGHTPPANALEYCETVNAIRAATTLSEPEKQNALDHINSLFDAEQNYLDTAPAFSTSVEEFFDWADNNQMGPTDTNIVMDFAQHRPTPHDLMNSDFIKTYRDRLLLVLRLKEISSLNAATLQSYRCALTEQGVIDTRLYAEELDESENLVIVGESIIDAQRQILNTNVEYVSSLGLNVDPNNFWGAEHANLVLAV